MGFFRKYWHFITGIVAISALGAFYLLRDNTPANVPQRTVIVPEQAQILESEPESDTEQEFFDDIVIHIEGAVNNPGVFTLPPRSRVIDALDMAGGATADADLARINLASFLEDAQQIIIPTETDEIELQTAAAIVSDSGLVNINTADERLLTTLPGIGPVLAGNIIAHREANGLFGSIEELQNVPRIGSATLNNLRDLITVN